MLTPIDKLREPQPFPKSLFPVAACGFNRCSRTLSTLTLARLWAPNLVDVLVLASVLDIGPASWAGGLTRVIYRRAVKTCNHLSRTMAEARP